jgi:protein-disulfide isomerase
MSKTRSKAAAVFGAMLVCVCALKAQTGDNADLRKQIEELRTEVQTLRAEVDQLKSTLHDLTTPRNPPYDISGAQLTGDPKAKVVLVEFSDYQCPFCMDYYTNTYHKLMAEYVKTGKLRYAVRDFPSESVHPNALQAAEAARCAAEQGKFWEMHDNLFNNQKSLGTDGIRQSAAASGLNMNAFQACYASAKYESAVKKDEQETEKLGVKGTPAFLLGTPDPANPGKIKVARALVGSQPFSTFQQSIDSLLAK